MVRKAKKYLLPLTFGGLYGFEEEEEAKIKIKAEHFVYLTIGLSILLILLKFLI
ncbi:MAG: hypothetical protein QXQ14_02470 [Candidatus Aenigmatarchaeota archaeon]